VNSSKTCQLPVGFDSLEHLVGDWALPSEAERNHRRLSAAMDEIQSFYDCVLAKMDDLVAHLGNYKLSALPDAERKLMYLALSLMEVAPAVEIYRQPDIPDAIPASRLIIRSPV
jgi:hypothetical protein